MSGKNKVVTFAQLETRRMTEPLKLTDDEINRWADDPRGPVALHLKQKLLPVEGEGGVIFPPTYADRRLQHR